MKMSGFPYDFKDTAMETCLKFLLYAATQYHRCR